MQCQSYLLYSHRQKGAGLEIAIHVRLLCPMHLVMFALQRGERQGLSTCAMYVCHCCTLLGVGEEESMG